MLLKQTPSFVDCSSSQQGELNSALSAAESISLTAYNDLHNAPTDQRDQAERYTTWFGTYQSSRYATVENNFSKIHDAFANQTITFNCGCFDDYYAYVYPNDPYNIYLCNVFWYAPMTGTDSKAGTLVHETSHFTVVAGTDDHVYGQSGCKALAVSSPDQAIDNADSHEYFAENNPALSMPTASNPGTPETPPAPNPPASSLSFILPLLLTGP